MFIYTHKTAVSTAEYNFKLSTDKNLRNSEKPKYFVWQLN